MMRTIQEKLARLQEALEDAPPRAMVSVMRDDLLDVIKEIVAGYDPPPPDEEDANTEENQEDEDV
jgi:hypothetical protein